jgi:lipoyl(octanoyl) transferase
MSLEPPVFGAAAADPLLQVYLLGSVDFEAALNLQRRLVYQVSGDRTSAALVLCEHPPLITVGREGSRTHILCEPEELASRRWRIRWINRGGGCQLHLPGQLAMYPIVALDHLGLDLHNYLQRIQQVIRAVLEDFTVQSETRAGRTGVFVGCRPIAHLGVAVRNWVTYFGAAINVNPDLPSFRQVRSGYGDDGPMTSLERERRGALAPALVRQRLLERFAACFGFPRMALFFDHPSLGQKAPSDAIAASS